MKPLMKILLIGVAFTFAGTEMYAQEKKKKPQDNSYVIQKKQADEQRKSDAEVKRKNDSLARVHYSDSLAEAQRADSVRWSKMGAPDSINPPGQQRRDSLDHNQVPPRMDKGNPPKGPEQAMRGINFSAPAKPDEDFIS